MAISFTPSQRAAAIGVAAAVLLVGAFAAGAGLDGSTPAAASAPAGSQAVLTGQATGGSGARVTVTGTGNVTGTPNQLVLSMGVQTNGASVSTALARANRAVRGVTAALTRTGVRAADIQTSGLSIQPNYGSSPLPDGYGVSESIQVTLRNLGTAGSQISDAVRAGGNATVVDGVSLNLSDNGSLLAAARARAVADARTKAAQYARALGQPLGALVTMSEQSPVQQFPVFNGLATPAAGRAVPVHPGTQQVSVTVTAVFALA
ncbi:MAG TPA: SIMPL domain-containing protein [Streptosporangiaceae bacterium]